MQNSQRHVLTRSRASLAKAAYASPSLSLLKGRPGKPAPTTALYCKFSAPVLLVSLLWSHIFLGMPAALILTICCTAALLLASRVKVAPSDKTGPFAKVRFGERIWLNRLLLPIPVELNARITLLYLVFWTGLLFALWGAFAGSVLVSLPGLAVTYAAQFSCSRALIHLYDRMKDDVPLYSLWTARPDNDNRKSHIPAT